MFTPQSVRSLSGRVTVVPYTAVPTVGKFARELASSLQSRATSGKELWPLVPVNELIDLVAQTGIRQDFDAAELYVLARTMACVNQMHMSGNQLEVRRALTSRLHDLLEMRPELLHENLGFAKPGNEGETPLLRCLVREGAVLDPKRLQAMAQRSDYAGEMLNAALQQGKDIGASLFLASLDRATGCCSTAYALVLADSKPQDLDDEIHQKLVGRAAGAAIGRQDWSLQLLAELKRQQDDAGGDGHRISLGFPDDFKVTSYDFASARGGHPITALVYNVNTLSGIIDVVRTPAHDNWPGDYLRSAAQALNDLLEPSQRLPLESIRGYDLFKLVTLCPVAAENGPLEGFWRKENAADIPNSPVQVLQWVLETAAAQGEPLPPDYVSGENNHKLRKLFGIHKPMVFAMAAKLHLEHTIRQAAAEPTATHAPARRMRAV